MMQSTKSFLPWLLLLGLSASCPGADWDQVFNKVEVKTAAAPPAAQPVAQPAAGGVAPAARAPRNRAARQAAPVAAQSPAIRPGADHVQVAAPADAASTELSRGVELYRSGRIREAARIFENRALAAATPAEQSSILFKVGVQWHDEVRTAAPDQRPEIRNAAVSAYQKTLEINPKSGVALNNLAQLLKTEPARSADADALLARAVELNDSRKGVYLMNRAALKRDSGDLETATSLARQAASDDRANLQAHRLVMNILAQREDPGALLEYIRDLDERGLVIRALDSAVDGMSRLPGARKPLLLAVATSLGNEAYTASPGDFRATSAGEALSKFSGDATIGPGVVELLRVLQEPVPAASLTWWREGFDGSMEPPKGSPAAAMQQLTRRCGEIHQAARDKRAEGYFRTSVAISGKISTDPRALLGLTEILFEEKRIDDLNSVLRENEGGLMEAKRQTMAASDDLHTYQLRLALGMLYGYTGRWVNPSQRYAASIWMLEHAQVSATDYNHRANLPAERQLRLPPNAVKMLSKGYSNDNQRDRSVTVRLEFADLYLKNGQKKLAQQVLDAEWQRSLPVDLDANLKRRLDALTAQAAG